MCGEECRFVRVVKSVGLYVVKSVGLYVVKSVGLYMW